MSWHERLIPEIAKVLQPKTYLELGVFYGTTLQGVNDAVPGCVCIGVDIVKQCTLTPDIIFYESTSIEYLSSTSMVFDLVFIDADHRYESAKKDLSLVMNVTHDRSVIMLHDTYPASESQSSPEYCGDSYRLVENGDLDKLGLESFTFPVGPGLTLAKRKGVKLPWQ